jgi:ethanolamine permease
LLLNTGIGIIALFTGKTNEIITIACFGAITLYIFGMLSVLLLRKNEPVLARPFRTPMYPVFPLVALAIAAVSLIAMSTLNFKLLLLFLSIMVLAYIWFHFFVKQKTDATETFPTA